MPPSAPSPGSPPRPSPPRSSRSDAEALLRSLLPLLAASGPNDSASRRRRSPRRCAATDPEMPLAGARSRAPHRFGCEGAVRRQGRPVPDQARCARDASGAGRPPRRISCARSRPPGRGGSRARRRDRSAALNRFGRAWLAAYGEAQGGARPARLRRHDRPGAGAARAARDRRLGALAARRRPRPHAGRRGAGHQPGAVAGDPGGLGRVLRRARARATSSARSSSSATRSSRSTASRAPTRRSSARRRGTTRGRSTTSAGRCSAATCSTRSARRGRSSTSSTRCSAARPAKGSRPGRPTTPYDAGEAGTGRALAVPARSRSGPTSDPGTSRSTRRCPTTRWRPWRRASPTTRRRLARGGPGAARRAGRPGDPGRRRDDPGAAARRRSSTR